MTSQPERKRPSYEPDKDLIKRLLVQSGKSTDEFAKDCGIVESTVRKMLVGKVVDARMLKQVADTVGLPWEKLLSPAERKRIGLDDLPPVSGTTSANPTPSPASTIITPMIPSRLFQLPAELTDFTGREQQILEITRMLCGAPREIRLPLLGGMGGIGKTSLAIQAAHQVKQHFPDAQLFLELRGTADGLKEQALTPSEAMSRIIRAFQPDAIKLPDDENELAAIYRSILASKRALIVLDNAGSEAQLRPLLTASPPVRFLITSRRAQALDNVESIQVDVLPLAEAFDLLRGITGTKGTKAELLTIAGLCGFLPLALRVAGVFLRVKDDWPVSRYIAALQQERLRWLKVGADPEKDVEAVLKLSSAQLVRDCEDRAYRWHLLHNFQGDFGVAAAAALWQTDENDLGVLDDLADLKNRSLISYDPGTRRYRLHDLMKPIAAELFS